MIEEISEGNWQTDYIWANGEPRVRVDNAGATETHYWYHDEHLGTPYVATDSVGDSVWTMSMDPFGEKVHESQSLSNKLLSCPTWDLDKYYWIINNAQI